MPEIAERALHTRVARSVEAIRRSFVDNLFYVAGRTLNNASALDHYTALAYTIRDRMLARMVASYELYKRKGAKTVAYLSAEFLLGPQLANNIGVRCTESVRMAIFPRINISAVRRVTNSRTGATGQIPQRHPSSTCAVAPHPTTIFPVY